MRLTFRFSITAERSKPPEEPVPQGDNFTQTDIAQGFTPPPELQTGFERRTVDDDDGGTYRRTRGRVGF